MPGKFVDRSGVVQKARDLPTSGQTIFEEDVSDPARLVDILTSMAKRISVLERSAAPEYIEFEKSMGASGTVTLEHNFNCPVRYSIVHWKGSANHGTSVDETNSTPNKLILNSYVAGRATIRVERAQANVTKGST